MKLKWVGSNKLTIPGAAVKILPGTIFEIVDTEIETNPSIKSGVTSLLDQGLLEKIQAEPGQVETGFQEQYREQAEDRNIHSVVQEETTQSPQSPKSVSRTKKR